jgi:hypothetical protein
MQFLYNTTDCADLPDGIKPEGGLISLKLAALSKESSILEKNGNLNLTTAEKYLNPSPKF